MPNKNTNQLIDILLKPFSKHLKSFICNRKYRIDLDEDTEIVTFDVKSMYTSIPHEFFLEDIGYFLTKYQDDLHSRFKNEFVQETANFILKNNTLLFDSKFYLQIKDFTTIAMHYK